MRQGFGTEASGPDRAIFEQRFACRLIEGYGSSEGGTSINVTPDTPPGSLGVPPPIDDVAVIDPDTLRECARARFDEGGGLVNAGDAIGEIVNRTGGRGFEGYYKNPDGNAERVHDNWYWSGDLGYRDEDGYFYFAGRAGTGSGSTPRTSPPHQSNVWSSATPRSPPPRSTPCPTPAPGTRSWRRSSCVPARPSTPTDSPGSLRAQPDLGTKWPPRFVRVSPGLPLTATGKITKASLRAEAWQCPDPVFWSPGRGELRYRLLTDEDRSAQRGEFEDHGRRTCSPSVQRPALDGRVPT